jgi:LuxR family maltose regulon positive regulatory protein
LQERHNDVRRLVPAVRDALLELDLPDAAAISPALQADPADLALEGLECLLGGQSEPFVLVLDDAQVLESAEAMAVLAAIARILPAGAQLALSSRTLPPLHIARLRAGHELVELRPADLAMTAAEATMLFDAAGLRLDACQAATLVERLEGWPAALYLAALSLRGEADVQGALASYAGDEEPLSDYLLEELIGPLATDAITFLTRSSILEQLSSSLCDAVLGRADSAALLQQLARRELLLVPLDRTGDWYRCPRPLRATLRRELARNEPVQARELHGRASSWYAEHGDSHAAIDHAVRGADSARAGELLWRELPGYLGQARGGVVQGWLRSFTDRQIAADAPLSLCAAHAHLATGDLASAEHWGGAVDLALKGTAPISSARSLAAGAMLLDAALARHGVRRMGEDASRAYELEPEGSPWRAHCRLYQGVASHLAGELDQARRLLDDAVHLTGGAMPSIETLCLAQLGMIELSDGDWELAEERCARALMLIERHRLGESPTSALAFSVAALVSAQRGRADAAKESLRRSMQLLGMLDGYAAWQGLETRILLARAAARLTDVAAARTLLAEASRASRRLPDAAILSRWLDEAVAELDSRAAAALEGSASLTLAELRILRFLPTHLSFREIGDRLHVSTNTVKSQAHAVYRKLDACSRSEAVARASSIGLIWGMSGSADM